MINDHNFQTVFINVYQSINQYYNIIIYFMIKRNKCVTVKLKYLFPALFPIRVIWCVCDVLFDAHQMFIFPSPDGGTCLFLRELLGDRREGGEGALFHILKKIRNYCYFLLENLYIINLFSHNLKKTVTFCSLKNY